MTCCCLALCADLAENLITSHQFGVLTHEAALYTKATSRKSACLRRQTSGFPLMLSVNHFISNDAETPAVHSLPGKDRSFPSLDSATSYWRIPISIIRKLEAEQINSTAVIKLNWLLPPSIMTEKASIWLWCFLEAEEAAAARWFILLSAPVTSIF